MQLSEIRKKLHWSSIFMLNIFIQMINSCLINQSNQKKGVNIQKQQ